MADEDEQPQHPPHERQHPQEEGPLPPQQRPGQYQVPQEESPLPPQQRPGQYQVPQEESPLPPQQQPGQYQVPQEESPLPPQQQPGQYSVPPEQSPLPPQQQPQVPQINPPAQVPQQPQVPQPQPGAAAMPAAARTGRGGRRPAKKVSRKRPSSYRKKPQPVDSGISVMSVLMAILGVIMLAIAIWALLPRSLTHIEGYPVDRMANKEPRNLLTAGQALIAPIEKDAEGNVKPRPDDVTFTEREVNDYLNYRFQGSQNGLLGSVMKFQGVYVDLRPSEAEIFIERSLPLIGRTTISTVIQSVYNDQKYQQYWKTGGGSIGKIELKSKNLQPVVNAFLRLSKIGNEELQLMNHMADVKIRDNKITLLSSHTNR